MTTIEQFVMRWLRYERRCVMLLNERHPRWSQYAMVTRPDCIGVTDKRQVIEVEVKRTVQDFLANRDKKAMRWGLQFSKAFPYQFYFAVPWKLVSQVEPFVPEWAGLMHAPNAQQVPEIVIVKRAPVNKAAVKMTLRDCVHASAMMTNQIVAQFDKIQKLKDEIESLRGTVA